MKKSDIGPLQKRRQNRLCRKLAPAVARLLLCCLLFCSAQAQKPLRIKFTDPGVFAAGIRTAAGLTLTDSTLNLAQGVGLQARLLVLQRLNTEWYVEWLRGGFSDEAFRTDLHLGFNILGYFQRRLQRVAPFLMTGFAADALTLNNRLEARHRTTSWTTAVLGAIGFHINLTWRSDLTIAVAYQHHLVHQALLQTAEGILAQVPRSGRTGDGHLLVQLSMNYKITDLWKTIRFR